jgi:hypothetical protein
MPSAERRAREVAPLLALANSLLHAPAAHRPAAVGVVAALAPLLERAELANEGGAAAGWSDALEAHFARHVPRERDAARFVPGEGLVFFFFFAFQL